MAGIYSLLVCVSIIRICNGVIVETSYGKIRGFKYDDSHGITANVFLGIPFAKPPIGDLRFERPEPPSTWTDVKDALSYGPSCTPHHRSAVVEPHSEDCLYLNVITPAEEKAHTTGHAVMVWIHGGGYCIGSASLYRYESIAKNFAMRDVIVVTIQYRLGPYGYLSNGDSVLPGNMGSWDQRAALRFIRENIASFGGDPNRVTVFGLSAGGASANALSLSPHTRDLFAQGIEMSGSSVAPWASGEEVVAASKELAKQLGCNSDDSAQMLECFKAKSEDEIFDAVDALGAARHGFNIVKFTPRVDGDLFPSDFEQLVEESPKKPTIIGLVEKEGALFTTVGALKSINRLFIEPENFEKFDKDDLLNFINNVAAPESLFGGQTEEVRTKLTNHYLYKGAPWFGKDYKFYLERYTRMISDICFNMPCILMKNLKVADGWPVWFYFNDHYNTAAFNENDPVKGATHLHEYPYLFDISPYSNFEFNDDEKKLQNAILTTFTNFAKFGNPSSKEFSWEPVTNEHPLRHMHFNVHSKMSNSFLEDDIGFWNTMDKYNYNIIRGRPKLRRNVKEEL